ncbi:MAG: hypothetical protein PHE88_04580 [Elusimicrobia bacterium]|nr:hypothetical protein [Elusimicrobiota bacterium]
MKKFNLFIIPALIGAMVLAGCGKNEKKTALLTGVATATSGQSGSGGQPATKSTTASIAANSASMAARAGASGSITGFAPHLAIANAEQRVATGLTGPDADGFFTYPNFTGTTMKIKFLNTAGGWLHLNQEMIGLAKINVKITSTYAFGVFTGDFYILETVATLTATTETMESGTITTADPVGGTFSAVISNMVMEKTTVAGIPMGIPISGTMAITGSSGYTGTNTYSKDGSTYKCEGPIYYNGAKVADVYLTFSTTFGNYTGYYIDATDTTGTHIAIE